ncbi:MULTISPECIES: fatty acid desaturase family protein [Streptomyces]|uniref:fatty acid desaturase family protein n=1 Tax=Streptomyces TaxID=1883 RepID=UPI000C2707F3|nr:fatty acid desaturase [Streptomyces sp. CB02613]PJN35153.1 stearoyl-CoA 9-desaturase [Streptomyces sp. CB02613]
MLETHEALPAILFERVRVSRKDELVFVGKLVAALVICCAGAVGAMTAFWPTQAVGVLVLAAMYTHLVELQHQCLHHSAFRRSSVHRPVGVLLGLPLLSAYSHYRVQHLQHHKYLGTPQDSEFFGFDTRAPLTWTALLRGATSPARLTGVAADVFRSSAGRWSYPLGQIGERTRRHVVNEYRLIGIAVIVACAAVALGQGRAVVLLWVLPLLLSIPIHFFLELPEHVLCDLDGNTSVMKNTRTISGSKFSRWFTNGNNFHVEHHAAMAVPINRLVQRHPVAKMHAAHSEDSYFAFYLKILHEVRRNRRSGA